MKKIILFWLSTAIVLTSCGKKENQVVEDITIDGLTIKTLYIDRIPNETIDIMISDLFTSFEIIPLETTSQGLVTNPTGIFFSDKNIFIVQPNRGPRGPGPASLLRFDRRGNYSNSIGRAGRGPGEHLGYRSNNIIADDNKEELFVDWQPDSMNDELMHYKYDGTFITKIPVPVQSLNNKTRYAENSWFATGRVSGKQYFDAPLSQSDSIMMMFFTDNGEITKIIPRREYPPSGSDKYSPSGGSDLYYHKNEYILYMGGIDTIYRISGNILIPIWVLHRGKDAVPYNVNFDRESMIGKHDTRLIADNGENLILWNNVYEDMRIVIVDKQTNKAVYVNIVDDVFGLIKPEEFRYWLMTLKDNRIARSWDADYFKKNLKESNISPESLTKYSSDPDRLKNISLESNPVIITFTLKSHIKLN